MKKQDPYNLNEYWHVVVTKNSISVEPRPTVKCDKNSICSFINREFAVIHANSRTLK